MQLKKYTELLQLSLHSLLMNDKIKQSIGEENLLDAIAYCDAVIKCKFPTLKVLIWAFKNAQFRSLIGFILSAVTNKSIVKFFYTIR